MNAISVDDHHLHCTYTRPVTKLELCRAHTPRAPCIHITIGHNIMLLSTFTCTYEASCAHEHKTPCMCIVGMVNGCGYDSQQKCIICDACRLCHLILDILKPVFSQNWQIHCAYNIFRCPNLLIWQSMTVMMMIKPITLSPPHSRG